MREHEDHLEELGVRWENNINGVLQGIGWERVDWVYLAEDMGKWFCSVKCGEILDYPVTC